MLKKITTLSGLAMLAMMLPAAMTADDAIPMITINTEGNAPVVSKDVDLKATLWFNPRNSGLDPLGSANAPQEMKIAGRGNYTWTGFDKKPYKIKFKPGQPIAGMPKGKNFALLAHADDNYAFLRNTLGFELSRRLGLAWTPSQQPVELTLNGDYLGLYFLTETIKVDKNRVNVVEQEEPAPAGADVTGGWVVEIDNYDSDPHITVMEGGGDYPIWFTYKSPEKLSKDQEAFLQTQMGSLDECIYAPEKNEVTWHTLCTYLDMDSAVKFYLVQEIMDNTEGYHGSCYLTRQQGDEEKWKFGPVWDFGSTFRRSPIGHFCYQDQIFHQVWIAELCKYPQFQELVKKEWANFTENIYPDLDGVLDSFVATISGSGDANFKRWPEYGNESLSWGLQEMKQMLKDRVLWLCTQWGGQVEEPVTVYCRGSFNSWDCSLPMTEADGKLTVTVPVISATDEFKFASADWKTIDLGGADATPLQDGQSYTLERAGKNLKMAEDAENVHFTLDLTTNILTVGKGSGVATVASDALSCRGNVISGNGLIRVFDLQGRTVAEGYDNVTVALPGLYIAVSGAETLKAVVK